MTFDADQRRQVKLKALLRSLVAIACFIALGLAARVDAQSGRADIPELTQPVNDFAGIIDRESAASLDRTIRALQAASGDVVVVATVRTVAPYADIREYALELFENHGRGIGERGKDNGC